MKDYKAYLKDFKAKELLTDTFIAVGLTLLSWLQLVITNTFFVIIDTGFSSVPGFVRPDISAGYFVLLALCFLPLIARRRLPIVVLVITMALYAVTQVALSGFTIAIAAPLVALYSVAGLRGRKAGIIALVVSLVAALFVSFLAHGGGLEWGTAVILLLQSIAFLVAAFALGDAVSSRQKLAEEALARALSAEKTREEEAARRVEEERVRIARELHDITAHSLSAVAVQAAAAERVIETDPAAAKEALSHIRAVAKDSLAELRALVGVLREPTATPDFAPAPTTERLGEIVAFLEAAGISVTLDKDDLQQSKIPAYADVALFRVAREAATNIVRHAQATKASIALGLDDAAATIEIRDNGVKKAPAQSMPPSAASVHGIEGMRERIMAIGGSFEAGILPEGGFRVFARIPLKTNPSGMSSIPQLNDAVGSAIDRESE
ncbi:MAG: two-component sensor histidine kinase [Actinobacteria bacterium]|nr:two-component sensor histidine kinase [Actinomycetota bacterium]